MKPTRFVTLLFALMLCVLPLGCFGPGVPSEDNGRTALEKSLNSFERQMYGRQADGCVRVASFDKTNGQTMDLGGIKIYKMDYEAQIEYTRDVSSSGLFGGSSLIHRQGDTEKRKGSLSFEQTERGWKGEDGEVY